MKLFTSFLFLILLLTSCSDAKKDSASVYYYNEINPKQKIELSDTTYNFIENDSIVFSGTYEIIEQNLFLHNWLGITECGQGEKDGIWITLISDEGISISPNNKHCFFVKEKP